MKHELSGRKSDEQSFMIFPITYHINTRLVCSFKNYFEIKIVEMTLTKAVSFALATLTSVQLASANDYFSGEIRTR